MRHLSGFRVLPREIVRHSREMECGEDVQGPLLCAAFSARPQKQEPRQRRLPVPELYRWSLLVLFCSSHAPPWRCTLDTFLRITGLLQMVGVGFLNLESTTPFPARADRESFRKRGATTSHYDETVTFIGTVCTALRRRLNIPTNCKFENPRTTSKPSACSRGAKDSLNPFRAACECHADHECASRCLVLGTRTTQDMTGNRRTNDNPSRILQLDKKIE